MPSRSAPGKRSALILLIPILLLPTILALAMPNENPSLARATAAVPVSFVLPAFALVLLMDYLQGIDSGGSGRFVASLAAAVLILLAARQDFDLTQRQYPAVYRGNVQNASEIGEFMREFTASIGRPEDAYLIPYPYWIDDRIMNMLRRLSDFLHPLYFPGRSPDLRFQRPADIVHVAGDGYRRFARLAE